jgi:methionine biosynthesis protein MetW
MSDNLRDADIRIDFLLISQMIKEGSTVLDVGCGNGDLLEYLTQKNKIDARGIELSARGVKNSISKGLSVIQGDAEEDIKFYPDNSFDYVLLSQTLQAMNRPDLLVNELLRVGKKAIVSFPNFGYWRVRLNLMLKGTMPVNKTLSHPWYSTPNIHFCTIRDFTNLCDELEVKIIEHMAINASGVKMTFDHFGVANFFATQGLYVISKE